MAARGVWRKRLFLVALFSFLVFLSGAVLFRSQGRKSLINIEDMIEDRAAEIALDLAAELGSKFHLQDFHRVEIKEGRPIWEVRAKEAKYYAKELVTHMNDASVVIYRDDGSSIRLASRAAILHLEGRSLSSAELEGSVNVVVDDAVSVRTELASYNVREREITAPGAVEIGGKGFLIKGVGLDISLDEQVMTLGDNVQSVFRPGAKVPSRAAAGLG